MADDRTIIFKVDLDVKSMEKNSKEAENLLKALNSERAKMLDGLKGEALTNQKNTVEYIKLNEQIRNQQKILKDNATALQINNELKGKSNLTTNEQLRLQKSLATAYNNLTDEQKVNSEISKTYADLNANLIKTGLNVNDGRRNVGRYKEAIIEAEKEIKELKNTVQQIGYVYGQNAKQVDDNTAKMTAMATAGQKDTQAFIQLEKETEQLNEAMKVQKNILDGATNELEKQEKQLESTKEEAQKIGYVFGQSTKTIADLKGELREMQDVMARTDANSEEYIKASLRAGELRDKLKEVKENTNQLAGGSGFEKMSNSMHGLKNDLLNLDFAGVAEKAKTLQTLSQNMTFKEAVGGLKNMGSALISMGKAILTNPLFLLAGVLVAIGYAMWQFIDDTEELEKAHENLNKTFEREIELLERANADYIRNGKERLEIMELQGASEEKLHNQRIQNIFAEELARQDLMGKLQKHLADQRNMYNKFREEGADDQARDVKKEIEDTKAKINELTEQQKDYYQKIRIEEIGFEKYKEEQRKKGIEKEETERKANLESYREFLNKLKELQLSNRELTIENERKLIEKNTEILKKSGADAVAVEMLRIGQLRQLDEKEKKLAVDRIQEKYRKEIEEAKGNKKILAELKKKKNEELKAIDLDYYNRQIELQLKNAETQKEINRQIAEDKLKNDEKIIESKEKTNEKLEELANENLEKEKEKEQQKSEIKQQGVELAIQLVNAYNEIVQRGINDELNSAKDMYEEKVAKLDEQLKKGLITQDYYDKQKAKHDKEFRKVEKELKTEAFEKDKQAKIISASINTAVAVTQALNNAFPLNVVLAGIVGALGGVQIGLIASQPTPEFAKGGVFGGKSHAEGGVRGVFEDGTQIEVEREEAFFVLNKKATPLIRQLSSINVATGGVPLMANGGTIEVSNRVQNERERTMMLSRIVKEIPTPIVLVEDINTAQDNVLKVKQGAVI